MNRRNCVLALVALGASPTVTVAQQDRKIPRLCFITFGPDSLQANRFGAFFDALRKLGYVNGQTIAIDYRSAEGHGDRYAALVAECLRLKTDVIVVSTTPAAQSAKQATRTVPIVMTSLGDPVGSGLIESLARPGGNVTGMTFIAAALAAKRVELLKELVPQLSRVLVLTYTPDPISAPQVEAIRAAASARAVSLHVRDIRTTDDFAAAFEAGSKAGAEALITNAESIFAVNSARVIELAARHKLPAIYASATYVSNGGLMSYIADFPALYAGAASHVDKILKGAKPADLPVEQPTKFNFEINLRTARALGIAVPPSLLIRADKVIE